MPTVVVKLHVDHEDVQTGWYGSKVDLAYSVIARLEELIGDDGGSYAPTVLAVDVLEVGEDDVPFRADNRTLLDLMAKRLGGEVVNTGGNTYAVVFERTETDQYLIAIDEESDTRDWICCYENFADDYGQRLWTFVEDWNSPDGLPAAWQIEAAQERARAEHTT